MSTTLDPTIAPAAREAAAQLVKVIQNPGPGAEADVGHLTEAGVIALVDGLTLGSPVEVDEHLAYVLRDALVTLTDRINPDQQTIDEVEANALAIATLTAEIRRVEGRVS